MSWSHLWRCWSSILSPTTCEELKFHYSHESWEQSQQLWCVFKSFPSFPRAKLLEAVLCVLNSKLSVVFLVDDKVIKLTGCDMVVPSWQVGLLSNFWGFSIGGHLLQWYSRYCWAFNRHPTVRGQSVGVFLDNKVIGACESTRNTTLWRANSFFCCSAACWIAIISQSKLLALAHTTELASNKL